MTKLSTHFKRSEFACKCGCGFDTVDAELLMVLQWLRYEVGHPVIVHSGCRCQAYNEKVGGADRSQHLKGRAADISVRDMTPVDIYRIIDKTFSDRLGLIRYDTFVHIDSRNFRYRDRKM